MAVALCYYTTPDLSKTVFPMFHHSATLLSSTHSCIMNRKSSQRVCHLPKALQVLNGVPSKNGTETILWNVCVWIRELSPCGYKLSQLNWDLACLLKKTGPSWEKQSFCIIFPHFTGNNTPGSLMEVNYMGTWADTTDLLLRLVLSCSGYLYKVVGPIREEKTQSLTYLDCSAVATLLSLKSQTEGWK